MGDGEEGTRAFVKRYIIVAYSIFLLHGWCVRDKTAGIEAVQFTVYTKFTDCPDKDYPALIYQAWAQSILNFR
jgi:hypothetical protein